MIKYGVIRTDRLYQDLQTWNTLYVAGRLQKPVLALKGDPSVHSANHRNRTSALIASLLLLPQQFTAQVLWSLSFSSPA